MEEGWRTAPEHLRLEPGTVDVWAWSLEAPAEDLENLACVLSTDEKARMCSFLFERDRLSYLVARGMLRQLLGRYLSRAPATLRFEYSNYGKPRLAFGQGRLDFNLSHTKGLAVAAFSLDLRVGVDVEEKVPIELDVTADLFSAEERAAFQSCDAKQRLDRFYNCWTRKEAIAKAEGLGLHLAMAAFGVSLGKDEPRIISGADTLSVAWHLFNMATQKGMAGALAVSAKPRALRLLRCAK